MTEEDGFRADMLAMKNAVGALIEAHPDPRLVREKLDRGEQVLLAALVPTGLSDECLDSMRATTERLRSMLLFRETQLQQDSAPRA